MGPQVPRVPGAPFRGWGGAERGAGGGLRAVHRGAVADAELAAGPGPHGVAGVAGAGRGRGCESGAEGDGGTRPAPVSAGAGQSRPPPPSGKPGLAEAVLKLQGAIRLKHYSQRTEETYVHWLRQYWGFLQGHKAEAGFAGQAPAVKVKRFLEHLAVDRQVAAATQNQALNALVFFYKEAQGQPVGELGEVLRAKASKRLPVVLTAQETRVLLDAMEGEPRLMARLLYGTGLRLMECLRLRVKDVDFGARPDCGARGQREQGPGDDVAGSSAGAAAGTCRGRPAAAPGGFEGGLGAGALAGGVGTEVSERHPGLGLAMGVSGGVAVAESADGPGAAAPRAGGRAATGGESGASKGRDCAAGKLPRAAALLRDPLAGERHRHSHGAGVVGAQGCEHDADIHARYAEAWDWSEKSAGWVRGETSPWKKQLEPRNRRTTRKQNGLEKKMDSPNGRTRFSIQLLFLSRFWRVSRFELPDLSSQGRVF